MAVRIRLRRMGRKKQPHYRVVVADSAMPRDGRFVENLGYYRPLTQPARVVIDLERVDYWIDKGAIPSHTVRTLVDKARRGGDDTIAVGDIDAEARKAKEAEELAARRKAEADAAREAEAAAKQAEAEAKEKAEAEAKEKAEAEAEEKAEAEAKEKPEAEAEDKPEAAEKKKPEAEAEGSAEAEASTAGEGDEKAEEPAPAEEEKKEG